MFEPYDHTDPSFKTTRRYEVLSAVENAVSSNDATAATIGEGKTNASCTVDDDPSPTVNAFAPNTVNAADPLMPFVTADTGADDPGTAHALPRSIDVTATPEPFVVGDTGENDDPDGPENDTARPASGAPAAFTTAADTATAPAAGTCPPGADNAIVERSLAANAGDVDIMTTAGTAQAAPVSIVRREGPPGCLSGAATSVVPTLAPSDEGSGSWHS